MVLVKVLKRKDASSVVVAVVVAMILFSFVIAVSGSWPNQLLDLNSGAPSMDWKQQYAAPALGAFFELLVLEALGWVYVLASGSMNKK